MTLIQTVIWMNHVCVFAYKWRHFKRLVWFFFKETLYGWEKLNPCWIFLCLQNILQNFWDNHFREKSKVRQKFAAHSKTHFPETWLTDGVSTFGCAALAVITSFPACAITSSLPVQDEFSKLYGTISVPNFKIFRCSRNWKRFEYDGNTDCSTNLGSSSWTWNLQSACLLATT